MLELLIVVLIVLWLTGSFVVPMGGSAIHILLVVALVLIVLRLSQGRKIL